MWDQILNLAIGNGLWAVLFCMLLVHLLKDSRKREERYVKMLDELSKRVGLIESIKDDTAEILKIQLEAKRKTKVSKNIA